MSEKTIMLVEDDQDQVLLAMRALRKHGIVAEVDEVVVARDGEEASITWAPSRPSSSCSTRSCPSSTACRSWSGCGKTSGPSSCP